METEPKTKPWYQSKIVWLGVISTAIGILQAVGAWLAAGQFQPTDFTTLAIGILMVILRVWFTDTELTK